jgi:hypothetical protein
VGAFDGEYGGGGSLARGAISKSRGVKRLGC